MKAPIFKFIGFIALILLIGIFASFIFFAGFAALVLSSSHGEVVQHTFSSPDNALMASVIRDDCGATCSCRVRVDLQAGAKYLKEIFRDTESCDASIVWLDNSHFEVQPDSGEKIVIDVNTLGLVK